MLVADDILERDPWYREMTSNDRACGLAASVTHGVSGFPIAGEGADRHERTMMKHRTPGNFIQPRKCHLQTRVFATEKSFNPITGLPMYRWATSAFVS